MTPDETYLLNNFAKMGQENLRAAIKALIMERQGLSEDVAYWRKKATTSTGGRDR